MTLDEAIKRFTSNAEYERTHGNLQGCLEFRQLAEWLKDYKRLLGQEPCEDAISRQAVDTLVDELARAISDERCCISRGRSTATIMQDILDLPSVKPQEPKLEQFAKWVATEIFDEWEYNKDSFAEIACRKLEKLGIVRAKGDEWELVEPQESEVSE